METESEYGFGPYRLDPRTRVLWRDDDVVPLTPKAVDLLLALVERRGAVATKAELFARVWPDVSVGEANLSVTVAALRKALGPHGPEYVRTVSRRGYRFAAPVTGASGARLSLAVLPFQVLGEGKGDDLLGAGMADTIVSRLSQHSELRVRRSTQGGPHAVAIGRELGVDAVLEGTLQLQLERARVSVHLTPLVPSVAPWSTQFDQPADHVFELQDAVAQAVERALLPHLGTTAPAPPGHVPPPGAYDAYLRGRRFWRRFDAQGIGKALSCFAEAAQADPRFALPHAGVADAFLIMGFSSAVAPAEAWPVARECAERALSLDPRLAGAYVSLAYARLFQDWDWAGARDLLGRAVALRPGSTSVRLWHGVFLAMAGDAAGSAREAAHARDTDPRSPVVSALCSMQRGLCGDPEGALELARRAAELDPSLFLTQWALGRAFTLAGATEAGLAALQRAAAMVVYGPAVRYVVAWGMAAHGESAEARRLLAEADALRERVWVSPYLGATVLAALGEKKAALARLEQACTQRDPWVLFVGTDPALARLGGKTLAPIRARVLG